MAKLLLISANQFPPLEKEHHTKRIWNELAKGFEEYHILARAKDNRFHHYQEANIHLHLVPKLFKRSLSIYITGFYLFYLIPKYKIDILMAQSAILGGLYATWASKIFHIPLMVEIHGEEYFRYLDRLKWYYFPLSFLIKYVFKNAAKVRSLNSLMTEKLARHHIINVREIPNRVDLDIFYKQKKDFRIGQPIKLISVGSFVPAKNYETLIELLSTADFDFRLTLIGGGKLKNSYRELIGRYSLDEKVLLIDRVDQKELIDKIIEADIYIQYSKSEGMPRTILEAMSLKMPIITTEVGSIAGVIKHKKNGYFVQLNDRHSLIEAIKCIRNDQDFREKMAANAYQDILDNYEWEKVFDIYRQTLIDMLKVNAKVQI